MSFNALPFPSSVLRKAARVATFDATIARQESLARQRKPITEDDRKAVQARARATEDRARRLTRAAQEAA